MIDPNGAAIWAILDADPDFVAGMARAREQFDRGEFTTFRHVMTDIENEPELPDNDPVPTPNPDPDEAAAVDLSKWWPLGTPEESR